MTESPGHLDEGANAELAARQAIALSTALPNGAQIQHRYKHRVQDVIAVTRSDLEDIRAVGLAETIPFSVGMFLLSGSIWVAIDKWLSLPTDAEIPTSLWVMLLAAVMGATLVAISIPYKLSRRNKINRILNEGNS